MPSLLTKKLQKRIRKIDKCETAFKKVSDELPEMVRNSIKEQITILTRIKDINEIIKFYGLFIITEWAEFGNLKEFYANHEININQKLSFALDIARGLNFLSAVSILHHDIRTENILITIQQNATLS